MRVWFCIPSKRPPEEANIRLSEWRAMGYKIALWRDPGDPVIECDMLFTGPYRGYHVAVNALVREVMARDTSACWLVTGGDDMSPDPNHPPEQIAAECSEHFGGTYGVMQPVGDRFGAVRSICGSPWMGREFCRRIYGGKGPFFEGYYHMWGDEEMCEITKKLGILWQRPDLVHYHHHWARAKGLHKQTPHWMRVANAAYMTYRPLFLERKRAGWPGYEPLPASSDGQD